MYFQLEDTPELSNFCNASSMGFFSEACRRPAGGNSFRLLICAARNCLAAVGTHIFSGPARDARRCQLLTRIRIYASYQTQTFGSS